MRVERAFGRWKKGWFGGGNECDTPELIAGGWVGSEGRVKSGVRGRTAEAVKVRSRTSSRVE